MATKTPRTTVKDYIQNVDTENEARRVLRRRSVAEDKGDNCNVPGSGKKNMEARSPRTTRNSLRAVPGATEEEVTPRHIIQNMLTVLGTAQPVTRKRKRLSDAAVLMGPPSSTRGPKTARRRSSLSAVDLDDVTRRFTPRTNIAGFLQQAPEETPAGRKRSSVGDGSNTTTTQNVSALMVNEVGVSMLENRSAGSSAENVSASGGRFRGKKGNLKITLPQVSPASASKVQRTPGSARSSRTSTPIKDVTGNADENVAEEALEVDDEPPVSPVGGGDLPEDLGSDQGSTSTDGVDHSPDETTHKSARSGADRSQGGERNVFTDVLGEKRSGQTSDDDEEDDSEVTPGLQTEEIQGGPKARTASSTPSSGRKSKDGADTPLEKSHDGRLSSSGKSKDGFGTPLEKSHDASLSSSGKNKDGFGTPLEKSHDARLSSSGKSKDGFGTPLEKSHDARLSSSGKSKDGFGTPLEKSHDARLSSSGKSKDGFGTPLEKSLEDISRKRSTEKITPNQSRRSLSKIASPSPSTSHAHEASAGSNRLSAATSTPTSTLISSSGKKAASGQRRTPSTMSLSAREESTHSVFRRESEEAEDSGEDEEEEENDGGAAFTPTASVHDATQGLSDQESSEGEGYSPLKTPRLPEKQRTPNTTASKLSVRNRGDEEGAQARRGKGRGGQSRRRKVQQGLPTSVVKATFSHFCQLRVSRDAIEEVEKMQDQYWKSVAEDLEAFALHAGRKTISLSDMELLMRRQGFVTDKCSMDNLIAKYLPLELRQELIPIARSGNKVQLGSKIL